MDLNINYDDSFKDLYDFRSKKGYADTHPIEDDYKYMVVNLKMTSVSLSCYFLGEFLTEIVCHDMNVIVDKYMSFKNVIDVSSSALWVFGEQCQETGFKQIIVGPMGCANSVKTDSSFYDFDLIENDYLNSLNFDERKSMNIITVIHNGEKDITIELDNLKLFMKLHVFMLLFHFFTEGLPKYDIDDADLPNQYDDDVENLPRIITRLYINNSIVCLDDLRDSIACKLDMCLYYERLNIKSIKEQLLNKPFSEDNSAENSMVCYELRFNVIKWNPYFCKYDDLNGSKNFKKISKRELIKPFALCYTSKNRIERFDVDRFRKNTTTDIVVEKVSVKISINQIASFLSMIRNTSRILTERYSNKLKNDEELMIEKRNPKDSTAIKTLTDKQDPIIEGFTVIDEATNFRETLDIFSNRYNKVPTMRIPKSLEVEDEMEEIDALNSKDKNILKLRSSAKLLKNDIEDREETKEVNEEENAGQDAFTFFFDGLKIYFINDYKDNFYPVLLFDFKDTNYARENRIDGSFVSQSQLEAKFSYYNLYNGYWEPFVEGLNISFEYDMTSENRVIQIKGKESINLNLSPEFISVINYCMKSWEEAQKSLTGNPQKEEFKSFYTDVFVEESKEAFDGDIKMKEQSTLLTLNDEDIDVVDVATPYKISNLTGMNIFVETLFERSAGTSDKYMLSNGQTTKIAVSYDSQAYQNSENLGSKIHDNVKIQFQGLYLPIEKIPLNILGSKLHKLTENDEENDFIYYENKVADMNKVLTLRTQNLLINSTQFTYYVQVANSEDKSIELKNYTLTPGECVAFPREDINSKISMKTVNDDSYSNYISAKKLIFNSPKNHTNYIKSGETYTMIRKESNKTIQD